jgi:hypothetical protein
VVIGGRGGRRLFASEYCCCASVLDVSPAWMARWWTEDWERDVQEIGRRTAKSRSTVVLLFLGRIGPVMEGEGGRGKEEGGKEK